MGEAQVGETDLTSSELERLQQLDSTQFGFTNLSAPEFSRDRALVQKTCRIYERKLLDSANWEAERSQEVAKIYLRLGHIYLLFSDFAKALSAYQHVIDLDEKCWQDPSFFYGLGLVYQHFRAYEFAAEAFRQVLYTEPCFERAGELHLRLGLIFKALEDWQQALKHFHCALVDCGQATLSKAEIGFHIAHCHDQRGDLRRAKELYEALLHDAAALSPQVKANVCRQLGWLLYRGPELVGAETGESTRLAQAVGWLNESNKADPGSGRTYYYLGRCYSAIPGRAHDAFVNYRQSIDKSEASADTWCSIGVLYQQQRQPMDALQAYVCAVQLDGHHSAAWTDLGLLYESQAHFADALLCFRNAAKHQPANPEALKARISVLEQEVNKPGIPQRPAKFNASRGGVDLPGLQEAWKLPIPAELTERQEKFLKLKQERYMHSSPLLTMGVLGAELDSAGADAKPPFYLNQQQVQMMHILQQNQPQLNAQQMHLLRQLTQSYHLMQQHLSIVHKQKIQQQQQQQQEQLQQQDQQEHILQAKQQQQQRAGSQELAGQQESVSAAETSGGGELKHLTHDDIADILGVGGVVAAQQAAMTPPLAADERARPTATTDDLLGGFGDSAGDGATKNDPMLSSAAISKEASRDSTEQPPPRAVPVAAPETSITTVVQLQDDGISSSSVVAVGVDGADAASSLRGGGSSLDQRPTSSALGDALPTEGADETARHRAPPPPPPPPLSLLAPVNVATSTTAAELLRLCDERAAHSPTYKPIFDERPAPPRPPQPPLDRPSKDKLLLATPTVMVESRKDALALELQQFCNNADVVLVRGLTAALRLDLSLFSTKTLMETAPDQQVEVRTQMVQAPDVNADQFGQSRWPCDSSRSFSTIGKYARYQAQSFQNSLREEQERLRSGGRGCGGEWEPWGKRRRDDGLEERQRTLRFGTNVDLSDERRWRQQLHELSKLPPFCRLVSGCNVLSHLGHTVLGMNTVQLYMKVPGARTPGHLENLSFSSANINIGPGECEWFAVPHEYWGQLQRLCESRGINFTKGSWWPPVDDLWDAQIPLYRFTQRPGDLVFVGAGCVHWVQSTGWCNNVAWNIGPMTERQWRLSLERHEFNKLQMYKSIVPMQHLAWQLARNVRFTQPRLFELVKQTLIRSFAYSQMVAQFAEGCGKTLRHQPRVKDEAAHYCANCEVEVWDVLLVTETAGGKYVVQCCDCARRADAHLTRFTVLRQHSADELSRLLDAFTLAPQKPGILS